MKKYFRTLERLEQLQLQPEFAHILVTTHKKHSWRKVTLHPKEQSCEGVKKYFRTLERLEQFQPNLVRASRNN